MRLSRLTVAVAVVLAMGALGIWYTQRPQTVTVVMPKRGSVAEVVYANGVVEPRTWAKVTALVRERIVEQCDCEGKPVEQGAVLARLDTSEAQAALVELEARLRLARDDHQRLSVLVERNATSQQSVDRASSEVAQLEALVAGQKAKLESYALRAPATGTVLRHDGEVGEIAEPGTILFWVGQPSPLIVVADVNEEDIPRVKVGQRALLRSDAFPNQNLEATVDSITPKGDPVTKTYRVRFKLPDDTPLMIGMSTDVNIVIRVAENALTVPSLALRGNAIFTVEDGRASRHEIVTGIRGTKDVEVQSGLAADARIISPYPEDVAEGARVTFAKE
ncbi:efflux transporter periplasmic adaptor subunit [Phyllobacterium brassicacearum]|uniref:Efflux transporter periplasmic adaptor subunit n=1 Tax=Phyllobacterium brassicacearum TaxID=314235 RepID=A0A2P7BTY8_9HYPH|nr:efflux RND transporter periplasmic adaptor subunit [Phyllobacterium brassicacearum]PSH69872.1 efflux transporter periplasmic adaptor subunit [Phyllobacterium brassicacearum]TDQ35044.1 RND family efflux transporter MFP subunit [Phyllobacterium brassicacearum]